MSVNAANAENGSTHNPSMGLATYNALRAAAIRYGAADQSPASSSANPAKKSATAAGSKTSPRSRARRLEKSELHVTEAGPS